MGGRPFPKSVETAKRDAEALRLRLEGSLYDEIAVALGFNDRSAARKGVMRATELVTREAADELIQREEMRLAALDAVAWEVLRRNHIVVSDGRIVRDENGTALQDSKPVLDALAAIRRNGESWRKLRGLDAPARSEVTVTDGGPSLDAELASFLAGLDATARDNTGHEARVAADGTD